MHVNMSRQEADVQEKHPTFTQEFSFPSLNVCIFSLYVHSERLFIGFL